MEMTITGINAATSTHLHVWDWRVALYLFWADCQPAWLSWLQSSISVKMARLLKMNGRHALPRFWSR